MVTDSSAAVYGRKPESGPETESEGSEGFDELWH
jgi:hypothetical protein